MITFQIHKYRNANWKKILRWTDMSDKTLANKHIWQTHNLSVHSDLLVALTSTIIENYWKGKYYIDICKHSVWNEKESFVLTFSFNVIRDILVLPGWYKWTMREWFDVHWTVTQFYKDMGQWRDTISHPLNAWNNTRPMHILMPTYQNNKLYKFACPLDHRLWKKFRFHLT